MAVYTIKGYFNTGFNSVNIPDSPAVLATASSKTFASNWLLQNKDLTAVRLNATWEEVQNIDYVAIGNSYYYVKGITMLTEVCAELSLVLDGLTTAGGVNAVGITGGWCKRSHTGNDALFDNNIPEPWQPSEPLEIVGLKKHVESTGSGVTLVCSTVDLKEIGNVAQEYLDKDNAVVCYVPKVPPALSESKAAMNLPVYGTKYQIMPNTMLFRADNFKEEISHVRELGIESCLTGSYVLPSEWGMALIAGDGGLHQNVSGKLYSESCGGAISYGSVNNKKCFSQYNEFSVVAIATGDKITSEAHDIYDGGASPTVIMFSDPSPENGKPYAQFKKFLGNTQLPFQNCVQGGTWLNQPMAFSGTSGSLIAQTQFTNRQDLAETRNNVNYGMSTAGNFLSAIGSALTGNLSGVLGSAKSQAESAINYEFANQQRQLERAEFETAQTINAPDVKFPRSSSIQAFVGNGFVTYQTRLSAKDLARFDRFLTMFGYAQSKPLEKSDFTNRRYFNYVQADGVNVSGNVGLRVRENIVEQLSGGVRIWHTLPNASYYNSNPIK